MLKALRETVREFNRVLEPRPWGSGLLRVEASVGLRSRQRGGTEDGAGHELISGPHPSAIAGRTRDLRVALTHPKRTEADGRGQKRTGLSEKKVAAQTFVKRTRPRLVACG
jgi:hypothetical protein